MEDKISSLGSVTVSELLYFHALLHIFLSLCQGICCTPFMNGITLREPARAILCKSRPHSAINMENRVGRPTLTVRNFKTILSPISVSRFSEHQKAKIILLYFPLSPHTVNRLRSILIFSFDPCLSFDLGYGIASVLCVIVSVLTLQ